MFLSLLPLNGDQLEERIRDAVERSFALIRALDPDPCAAFTPATEPIYVRPDIYAAMAKRLGLPRRTVAKYRLALGIPPARSRRRGADAT